MRTDTKNCKCCGNSICSVIANEDIRIKTEARLLIPDEILGRRI